MTQESENDRTTQDPGDQSGTASEDRITANEREDGVRRTADDELVHPAAAGETDPDAAADPTIPPDSPHGQPTGED
ncbi:hypothetical protein BJY22_004148 [Kribbella shirazensis]|jgi:hypothetical protein|uniref:Uncharacterized protein n=1 Tax=Kribbella shirazensis TaxID=1105143 RepID=A0A7X6A1P3_9ACTN|nr:hypothetical protein [Kribbella shirazensis]